MPKKRLPSRSFEPLGEPAANELSVEQVQEIRRRAEERASDVKAALESRERDQLAAIRARFAETPRPKTIGNLTAEVQSFRVELIDGDTVAALAIGRDMLIRWKDCLAILGKNAPEMPSIPPMTTAEAFADVLFKPSAVLVELKEAVDVVARQCATAMTSTRSRTFERNKQIAQLRSNGVSWKNIPSALAKINPEWDVNEGAARMDFLRYKNNYL